ncbi:hypothetical protein JNUCC31_23795 [Paenibacillus sp. JNUCC31]|uniref:hypothetical protein n=1 Tax=Paenibacillus sp. JNUCC-31 TaxID=2777983 RepID=UPI00177B74F3|nr:hypothetical protein [Paenibacillus sp. JNUCC-31]QOS77752.1 hypothetical protein JNUCC31_23795 [Paenibacillus sp. JNUCC-31]
MTDLNAYHYFEKSVGPFRNLSSLSEQEAEFVARRIRQEGRNFASQRSADYMMIRRALEQKAYDQFIAKGGKPTNRYPHYLTLGACAWLESWYTDPDCVTISWEDLPPDSVSFTYGDLFPTMRYLDDKAYRKQVYTKDEILDVIQSYGWPQEWNRQGDLGPERYIEVQVWNEGIIRPYRQRY